MKLSAIYLFVFFVIFLTHDIRAQATLGTDKKNPNWHKEPDDKKTQSQQLVVIGVPNIKKKNIEELTTNLKSLKGVSVNYYCDRDKVFVLYVDRKIYDSPPEDMVEAIVKKFPYIKTFVKQMENLKEYKGGCK